MYGNVKIELMSHKSTPCAKIYTKKAKELNVTKTVVNNWSMKFLITKKDALKLKITSVPINQLQYSAKTLHLHQKLLHINYKTAKILC